MNIADIVPVGVSFVVIAVVLGFGATLVADIQSDQSSGTYAYNISDFGLGGLNKVAKYLPTIGLVIAIVIIIGLITRSLMRTA